MVSISPSRGAVDVRSNQPVQIRFDRPMDRASVAKRFHLEPASPGTVRWLSDREMAFDHPPLQASTKYLAVLEPGYRDARGGVDSLRHSWQFTTEAPPVLAGTSPGAGDSGVDPAAYIGLTFSHAMDLPSLAGSLSVSPSLRFTLQRDPTDPRRVILAPQSLLEVGETYSVAVTTDARDVDGNHLQSGVAVSFRVGPLRGLHHWIGFVAQPGGGLGQGVWIVDENRIPRRLVSSAVQSFSWSPDGSRLLIRGPEGGWSDQALDLGTTIDLPFQAAWAAFLAPGQGYAFRNGGTLSLYRPDGRVTQVAGGVSDAAVAPGGRELAYALTQPDGGSVIMAYELGLGTEFRLQQEPGPVDGLAWSPDGLALAYRTAAAGGQRQVRVRLLQSQDTTVTVARGDVSAPTWQADSRHLIFAAEVRGPSGPTSKAFRLTVGAPPPAELTAQAGLPTGADTPVRDLGPSPDGHQIAFLSDVDGRSQVWLMNADGTGLTQLTRYDPKTFPYSCSALAWTPS